MDIYLFYFVNFLKLPSMLLDFLLLNVQYDVGIFFWKKNLTRSSTELHCVILFNLKSIWIPKKKKINFSSICYFFSHCNNVWKIDNYFCFFLQNWIVSLFRNWINYGHIFVLLLDNNDKDEDVYYQLFSGTWKYWFFFLIALHTAYTQTFTFAIIQSHIVNRIIDYFHYNFFFIEFKLKEFC